MKTKVCTKCNEEKPIEEFYACFLKRERKVVVKTPCKTCIKKVDRSEYLKQYQKKNKERISKKRKEYYNNSDKKEARKKYLKEYYQKNKDRLVAASKKYNDEHKDKLRDYKREYAAKMRHKLSDNYVAQKLKNNLKLKSLKELYLVPELIEAKRTVILSKRIIKKLEDNGKK